tara:strand:+ start:366 stop:656 length:291 start_codon:yes stop_codon:yes gene_type:complete
MENLYRMSIQIQKGQYKKLKAMSGPGISISYLIRSAIDKYFSKKVSFQKSEYSEYESKSISALKQIHALTTLRKNNIINDQEFSSLRDRLNLERGN